MVMSNMDSFSPVMVETASPPAAHTLNSTDALAKIDHGSEIVLNVTPPVGNHFITTSTFIGCHSNNTILVEMPAIAKNELDYYFQEGFWINIRAYSQRGEGATILFRTQIQHKLSQPLPLLVLDLPNAMHIQQLRKETRYDVNLRARLQTQHFRSECEIRDLSKSGCQFIMPSISRTLELGSFVSLELLEAENNKKNLPALFGEICNVQKPNHYAQYGVRFDESGRMNAQTLLNHLKFNGTKLVFK